MLLMSTPCYAEPDMPEKSRSRTRDSGPSLRKPKGSYHHGNLRRALIDAALGLIEKEGAAALSLRAAARRAGVSTAAPYRHFPSRKALLAAVAEEGFRLLAEEFHRVIAVHGDDPARCLGELGVAYVLFAAAHPSRYNVMLSPELADRTDHPSLEAAENDTRQLLLGAVLDYQEAGWMSSRDPGELVISAWSSVHGLASLITSGQIPVESSDPAQFEEIARAVVRSLVPGFDG
jgi:AcrR family transcriptional regulator